METRWTLTPLSRVRCPYPLPNTFKEKALRTLKFIVDKQIIRKDDSCDFEGLVSGTEGYLKAQFSFSSEWNRCAKVAGFYSNNGIEYEPQALDSNNCCIIPSEALKRQSFNIKVFGKREGYMITTNKINIMQDGGRK